MRERCPVWQCATGFTVKRVRRTEKYLKSTTHSNMTSVTWWTNLIHVEIMSPLGSLYVLCSIYCTYHRLIRRGRRHYDRAMPTYTDRTLSDHRMPQTRPATVVVAVEVRNGHSTGLLHLHRMVAVSRMNPLLSHSTTTPHRLPGYWRCCRRMDPMMEMSYVQCLKLWYRVRLVLLKTWLLQERTVEILCINIAKYKKTINIIFFIFNYNYTRLYPLFIVSKWLSLKGRLRPQVK